MTTNEYLKSIKNSRASQIINHSKGYPKHPVQINYYPELGIIQIGIREVKLTPLEKEVMDYLYENAGKPCTEYEVSKHAISKLRGIIEPNSRRPQYIVYVKGVGYVLKNVI